jgi:YD repeat-containing protein
MRENFAIAAQGPCGDAAACDAAPYRRESVDFGTGNCGKMKMSLHNARFSLFSMPRGMIRSSDRAEGGKMKTRTEKVLLALFIAGLTAAAATASETINYTYDSRGRLVQVKHSGTVNNNVTANYQYDKADNRTNVNVASPNPVP